MKRIFGSGVVVVSIGVLTALSCAPAPQLKPAAPRYNPPPPDQRYNPPPPDVDRPAQTAAVPVSPSAEVADLERQTFSAVNAHRVSVGLSALRQNSRLAQIARAHSRAMAEGSSGFGHEGFARRAAQVRSEMPARGFAENVSKSSRAIDQVAPSAMHNWLNSAVHRKNIEGRYSASGVGAARSASGTTYMTQIFIGN